MIPDKKKGQKHIVLTSHPGSFGPRPIPIVWGHSEPRQRGPVIATLTEMRQRNAIGTHAGAYAVYRAIVDSGIQIVTRIPLPEDRIPPEAYVEINAKKAAGYYTEGPVPDALALAKPLGRGLEEQGMQEPERS